MIDLVGILNEKIESVEKNIKQAAFERDNSATPMESQHDQSRQIANQLYNSLLEERKILQLLRKQVGNFHAIYSLENLNSGAQYKFFIVPDGLGGKTVDGVTLISEKTPLSKIIIGKDAGYEYELSEQKFKITKIEENSQTKAQTSGILR
jgi:hypothetical protein